MDTTLVEVCKQLKLSTTASVYDSIEYRDREQYLLELFDYEVQQREASKVGRLLKKAGLPKILTLDGYDFDAIAFSKHSTRKQLIDLDFIENRENVLMLGAVGTGKTHLAIALATLACKSAKAVRFFRAVDLVNILIDKHRSDSLTPFMSQFKKCQLLVIDELGFVPFHRDGSQLLFNVIADCYEQRSVIVTSNLEFGQWNSIFGDSGGRQRNVQKRDANPLIRLIR